MWREKSIAPSTKKFWLDFATDFLFIAASYTNLEKRQQLWVGIEKKNFFWYGIFLQDITLQGHAPLKEKLWPMTKSLLNPSVTLVEYPIPLTKVISTISAFRRPMTYNNHPIPSHPIPPIRPIWQITLNELSRPKIDLSRPSMTQYELKDAIRSSKTIWDHLKPEPSTTQYSPLDPDKLGHI